MRRLYGSSPAHLLASACCITVVALALVSWLDHRSTPTYSGLASTAMPGMATGGVPRRVGTDRRCSLSACPIPTPEPDELSVAGQLGSALAAVWVASGAGDIDVRLELLNPNMGPVREPITIAGNPVRRACGPGCWTFALPGHPASLRAWTRQGGRRYAVRLPLRWVPGRSAVARALLGRAVATMRSLVGVRDHETITAGPPGPVQAYRYRLSAPDRMAYTMNTGGRVTVIAGTEWSYSPGPGWTRGVYGSGRFTTASWYDWGRYARAIQMLGRRHIDGRRTAEIALMDPDAPVWFRLRIDVASGRVSWLSMMAGGHFMIDRYTDFGQRQVIRPPHG